MTMVAMVADVMDQLIHSQGALEVYQQRDRLIQLVNYMITLEVCCKDVFMIVKVRQ